jgi:hypothetical protein
MFPALVAPSLARGTATGPPRVFEGLISAPLPSGWRVVCVVGEVAGEQAGAINRAPTAAGLSFVGAQGVV